MTEATNPITKYLAITSGVTVCLAALCAFLEWRELTHVLVLPLALACTVLVSLYAAFALRNGFVGLVGHAGQIHTYSKKEQPITFFLISLLYLLLPIPAAFQIASVLLSN